MQELCEHLKITEQCRELIWKIVSITVGLKIELLYARHVDQLVMCAIYGVCKIHQGSKEMQVMEMGASFDSQGLKFQHIINAYKELHRRRLEKAGNLHANVSQGIQWIYLEVNLSPLELSQAKVDIIQFYNDVYLDKMKTFIMKTKSQIVSNDSNKALSHSFESLLGPAACDQQPVISHFTKLTPLAGSVRKNYRYCNTVYQNNPSSARFCLTSL